MVTHSDWVHDHSYILSMVANYLATEGCSNFLKDLQSLYPELYDSLIKTVKRNEALGHKEVPAILRTYRRQGD